MMQKVDVKNKLGTLEYIKDAHENAHIVLNPEICRDCPHHMCYWGCPAKCFTIVDGQVIFQYEDCVECGSTSFLAGPDS